MVDTSVWNPKVKFTNLPANFILLQDTGSLLMRQKIHFVAFLSVLYILQRKKTQNTPFPPPKKIHSPL